MTRPGPRPRGGFTLIELLVVIGLIAALAAIVLAVGPGALEKDRAVAAVTQVEGALQISRAKAARDNLPRGVRLLVSGGRATEYQFIESPPVYVPNPAGPSDTKYVQFEYTIDGNGRVTSRTCTLNGLPADQLSQITAGSSLYLPTLGTWHEITGVGGTTVTLATYPDAAFGAQTRWRTYHFGAYAPPRPLLGEANARLPQRTAIDMATNRTSPSGTAVAEYDILFAPAGNLIPTPATRGAGHVFLWFRDPDRPNNLQEGGEQLLLVIKGKTGAIGVAPVDWDTDPYALGRKAVSGN